MIPGDLLDNFEKDLGPHPVRINKTGGPPLATCLQQARLNWIVALLSVHRIVNRRMNWS